MSFIKEILAGFKGKIISALSQTSVSSSSWPVCQPIARGSGQVSFDQLDWIYMRIYVDICGNKIEIFSRGFALNTLILQGGDIFKRFCL